MEEYKFKPIRICKKCGLSCENISRDKVNKVQIIALCNCNSQ